MREAESSIVTSQTGFVTREVSEELHLRLERGGKKTSHFAGSYFPFESAVKKQKRGCKKKNPDSRWTGTFVIVNTLPLPTKKNPQKAE